MNRMQAVGYARWSSLEQGRGNTAERQLQIVETFCRVQDWPIVEHVTDEGSSAFTGANIHTGNLGKVMSRVERGELPRDVVIVVEQLDRISRLPPSQVIAWIHRVTAMGVSIATANDGLIIDSQMIDANPMNFMNLVFNSFRAYQESKHKSERLSESWNIRRSRLADNGCLPVTSVCPAWLRMDSEAGKFVTIPERVLIIEEIFRRTLAGDGKRIIARDLNERGVVTWGRGASKAEGWHPSYIGKVLSNPAVVGQFQAHTKPRGETARRPVGEPIQGYFPSVISEKIWAEVQSRRATKRGNNGQRGEIRNLFSGLGRCGCCGGVMTFQLKNPKGFRNRGGILLPQKQMSYFLCDRHVRRVGCANQKYYRYEDIESGLLDGILSYALRDEFFAKKSMQVASVESHYKISRIYENKTHRVRRLLELYTETGVSEVKERWMAENIELKKLEKDLSAARNEMERVRGSSTPDEHIARVRAVRVMLDDADDKVRLEARVRVSQSMREIIECLEFNDTGTVTMFIRNMNQAIQFDSKGNITGDVVMPGKIVADFQKSANLIISQ